jgi:hypothetical protein
MTFAALMSGSLKVFPLYSVVWGMLWGDSTDSNAGLTSESKSYE